MPFVPAPNVAEVQFRYTLAGQQAMNRIHVNCFATPTLAFLEALTSALAGWWLGNVQDLVSSEMTLREVYAKSLEEQPGPEATFTSGLPASGTASGEAMPNNVSLAVSLRSDLTGRSARGRWYWCGFVIDQVLSQNVAAGTVTDILAAMVNLKDEISSDGFLWIIVSYVADGAPRAGGPVYFEVKTLTLVDTVVDSQRRRLPGRGR